METATYEEQAHYDPHQAWFPHWDYLKIDNKKEKKKIENYRDEIWTKIYALHWWEGFGSLQQHWGYSYRYTYGGGSKIFNFFTNHPPPTNHQHQMIKNTFHRSIENHLFSKYMERLFIMSV